MLIVCIILGVALAAVLTRLILLKYDIRCIERSLGEIVCIDTNMRVTTNTFDKSIVALSSKINTMLEQNRHNLFEKVRAETDLKRAVTNISHDLRTPLTSALGYLQMVESSELDDQTKSHYVKIIGERLGVLSSLMNNLFEFAQLTEGTKTFNIQKVNVCNSLRDILSVNYSELDAMGILVDANIPDAPAFFLCDEDALQRILQNLIKNICVHGKEYLRIRLSEGVIEFANKTNNLSELDTEQIFERFYTADASRTSKNTGLGLAIAKELVIRMNGRLIAGTEDNLFVIRVILPQATERFHEPNPTR